MNLVSGVPSSNPGKVFGSNKAVPKLFESLTEKLNGAFARLTGKGRLSEKDIDEALREVRLALR